MNPSHKTRVILSSVKRLKSLIGNFILLFNSNYYKILVSLMRYMVNILHIVNVDQGWQLLSVWYTDGRYNPNQGCLLNYLSSLVIVYLLQTLTNERKSYPKIIIKLDQSWFITLVTRTLLKLNTTGYITCMTICTSKRSCLKRKSM